MDRLKDKVAIVTGSGDGIGKAIALLFAQEGAKVVVTCRREAMGQEVVREIQEKGGQLCTVLWMSRKKAAART